MMETAQTDMSPWANRDEAFGGDVSCISATRGLKIEACSLYTVIAYPKTSL